MYIIKNALKCIARSKGRNILIGVIVLVIAFSACIGLSIRQAAEKAKSDTLDGLTVTATISFDRQAMMQDLQNDAGSMGQGGGRFDKGQFAELMGDASSLSLEEYQKYAEADCVKDFYYSQTISMNGSDNISPVTTETTDTTETAEAGPADNINNAGAGKGEMMGGYSFADFQVIGYSSESAMTSFVDGTASITEGSIFEEGTEDPDCIISQELAAFNDISVGDTIELVNPNNEVETYTLTVSGLYTDSSANESAFGMHGMTFSDPANQIYMSCNALQIILSSSESLNAASSDETQAALSGEISGTYVFADAESYARFEEEVRELGLDDSYTVSSSDLTAYENSLAPLSTLSSTAGWFLMVILIIGAIILIVLNIFNVRERKYEIGVLTAMGMSKIKVALQFLTEIFVVTLAAVIIGAAAGAVSSVPVTNALLASQVEAQTSQSARMEQNFGRGGQDFGGGSLKGESPSMPETNYISEINSATNMTVIIQMLGIAVLLTLISGAVSMLFIMRYEPLKILANRD
ncbi:MAG: FtsX-like permease family protein [Roseburia sp.]